ncbi:hypothetical protein [Streptomyces sp. NPDC088400]|uniref:hypothetical protein n=1 Tax=Streptomyces sp. NPDC088400 TaxID=3365861 RepID=UPI0037F56B11
MGGPGFPATAGFLVLPAALAVALPAVALAVLPAVVTYALDLCDIIAVPLSAQPGLVQ